MVRGVLKAWILILLDPYLDIKVKNDSFTEFSIGVRSFCSSDYKGELTYYFYVVDDAGVSSDVFTYIFNNTDNEKTVGDCPIV